MISRIKIVRKRLYDPNPKSMSGVYFSVSFDLVAVGVNLPYDLFINSSIIEEREKFVKIFKKGNVLAKKDLKEFQIKYYQLYILESQRSDYLTTINNKIGSDEMKKINVLKQTAINHLKNLFENSEKMISQDFLVKNLNGCRDVVHNIIQMLDAKHHNIDSLQSLIGNLCFHDFYTYDHSVNVSMYCILIYKALHPDATESEILTMGMGGLLHDIGKVKISTEILNGTGSISEANYTEIKKHPQLGFDLIKNTKMEYKSGVDPACVSKVVLEHHENYDGTGYPNKVEGPKINKLARICAIADFFDAVTTKRSYQDPLPISNAIALMTKYVGKKLDPEIFSVFVSLTDNYIKNKVVDIAVTSDFDPCQPNSETCFCKDRQPQDVVNFGDIVLVGKSPQEYEQWLKSNNKNIKFKKIS